MKPVYKAHPWHGISIGEDAPNIVTTFIEIVPSDTIKYEIDKETGYLSIDRPQKYSNIVPSLYGFIPRTYCGDGDPLDICVLSSHHIPHGDILLQARPIGGLCLVDKGEADDKIIAVLVGDHIYGEYQDLQDMPKDVVERLKHYFLTYKNLPDEPKHCEIAHDYGVDEAKEVIKLAMKDYRDIIFNPI
ncbi:UNVERIFIED_CONTAM: hypothetical protein GTU68_052394 [Idotea baltica]|nr:hypothetical protein [Idotea baltica]